MAPVKNNRGNRFALFFRAMLALARVYAGRRDPAWATPVHLPSSDNFYALNPKVFRSAQPTSQALAEYEKLGLKTVLQLRLRDTDAALLGPARLKLLLVPMKLADIGDEQVVAALKLIAAEPGPILIHCRQGADRTGLIAAMYRIIFEGWSRKEALREMIHGGYGFHRRKRQNIVNYLKSVDIEAIKRKLQ